MLAPVLVLVVMGGARGWPAVDAASGPEQVLDAFVVAFNARDAGRVAALYTETAELMPPDGAPVKGRAAIQAAFGVRFNHPQLLDVHVMSSETSGALAYVTGRLTLSTRTREHGADVTGGNCLLVLRLETGQWKIAYHMFTLPLRPEFVG